MGMGASRALVLSAGISVGLYFGLGFPGWIAAVFSVLCFLGLGGWPLVRCIYRTLPRDVKGAVCLARILLTNHRWKNSTVPDIFAELVARHPTKAAILYEEQVWVYRDLDNYSNQVGIFFQYIGVKPGNTIAVFMTNCPEYIGIVLGIGKIGAKSALINFNLRGEPLIHSLKICNPSAIIFDATLGEAMQNIHDQLSSDLQRACFAVNGKPSVYTSRLFDDEVKAMSSNPPPHDNVATSDSWFCYIYTSGTTGLPKAVPIRHQRYMYLVTGLHYLNYLRDDDILYCSLPLYHTNGGVLGVGQCLLYGNTIALRRKFSASQFWNDCIRYRCTVIQYIGEVCRYLLAQPPRATDKQHCVRLATGNGLRKQIWEEFMKRFNISEIVEFYGATEGNASIVNNVGKVGSCGFKSVLLPFVHPLYIVKVDPETEEIIRDANGFCIEAAVGEKGEMVSKIKNTILRRFDGYENKEATSKKILHNVFSPGDRFFRSGDMLLMDEDGFFYFADRTGDTFRWKGENVSTAEVEGQIAKVYESDVHVAVFGVDVPGSEGKAGMAVIEGSVQLVMILQLAQKFFSILPSYSVPVFIRVVDKIEMTGTHKYKKTTYRKEGFAIDIISDPLYILDFAKREYVPLTEDIYQQVLDGLWRF